MLVGLLVCYASIALAATNTNYEYLPPSGSPVQWIEDNTMAIRFVATAHNSPIERFLSVSGDIAKVVDKYDLNEECFYAIIRCESNFDSKVCNQKYGCSSGIGLMQIIPNTLQHCSEKLGRKIDPYIIQDNLECGAYLLKNEGTYHWGTEDSWWGSWDCWHKECN